MGLHSGGGEARCCLCNGVMAMSVGCVGLGCIGHMGRVGHVGCVGEESMGHVGEVHGARR